MWLATVLADQTRTDELADTPPRHCRVVGDHDQIALALAHELVDQAFGSSDAHEAADHEACAIRNHGGGIFNRDGFHGSKSCFSMPFVSAPQAA